MIISFRAGMERTQSLPRRSKLWEAIAAAQFSADGVMDGWDSDDSDHETPEQKYMKVLPSSASATKSP
jgi:hypothetical protein